MNFAGINGVESPTQSPTTASTPTASPAVTERPTLAISSDANVVFWTTTDNFSEIYLNGVMVGSTNGYTMPFSFSLTGKLLNGYNVIAVAAHDTGSFAAMQAQLVLAGTSVLVGSSSTGWKYSLTNPTGWADATFNDSSWLTPVAKSQSSEPWGNKMPINDGSAGWIWSTDPFSHNDVYFRIGFMYTASPVVTASPTTSTPNASPVVTESPTTSTPTSPSKAPSSMPSCDQVPCGKCLTGCKPSTNGCTPGMSRNWCTCNVDDTNCVDEEDFWDGSTESPTASPSQSPTTASPTASLTASPTQSPTNTPTVIPTASPTQYCFPDTAILQTAVSNYIDQNCATNSTCPTHTQYGEIGTWCVKLVTSMMYMFNGKSTFNSDISRWDVSSVTNMAGMFWGASSFNSDISNWNVGRVTNMYGACSIRHQASTLTFRTGTLAP